MRGGDDIMHSKLCRIMPRERLPTAPAAARRARGFTLLEVLVALVVLSIGLLGIGKLVMASARGNDSAYMRSQATALAYAILDAMRANRDQAIAGAYNVSLGSYTGGANCVTPNTCTAAQLVAYDLSQWKGKMAVVLPNGDGSIVTAAVPGADGQNRYTAVITVTWNDWAAQQIFNATSGATSSVTLESIL